MLFMRLHCPCVILACSHKKKKMLTSFVITLQSSHYQSADIHRKNMEVSTNHFTPCRITLCYFTITTMFSDPGCLCRAVNFKLGLELQSLHFKNKEKSMLKESIYIEHMLQDAQGDVKQM